MVHARNRIYAKLGQSTPRAHGYRRADISPRHTLTDLEKADYLQAEKCLLAAPAKGGVVDGAVTRWDELHWVHITQSNIIHSVGDFLPWHRLYVTLHEKLLQDECNYTGAQPYWDEQRDADASIHVADASVWGADDLSFGTTQDGCVVDGAFANTTLRLNQEWGVKNTTEYCLSRSCDDSYWACANSTYSDTCFAKTDYSDAWPCWSKYPHSSAHLAVGGTVSWVPSFKIRRFSLTLVFSSSRIRRLLPASLFFLHHANLDRLWWRWQQQGNLSSRLYEMSGRSIPPLASLTSYGWLFPSNEIMDYDGDAYNTTTLNHVLWMANLAPNATISEVMDLGGDSICAEYVG
ncbi:putative Tyrosinase copper-binding domain-containing protein [Seiridium unicorne]|uniref:Tyrosinase copper-binding domain-containing protein n=1 Tax=Seiridium unicorne TaxID=138068 RepID=A0ABR2UZT3_9PEZI